MDQSKEDRLRHVIAFFMEESETEARQRMSLESTNLGLARQIAELTADVHNTKDIMDRFLHGYLELFPGDTRVHETPVTDLALQRLEVVRDENSRANVLGTLYHEVCDAYAIANPDKTFTADPDHLRVRLLELIRTKSDRCDSCEHSINMHQEDGCWHIVGKRDKDSVCPCGMKRSALFSEPYPVPDATREEILGQLAQEAEHRGDMQELDSLDIDLPDLSKGKASKATVITIGPHTVPFAVDARHSHHEDDECEPWCIARGGCGDPDCAHAPDGRNHPMAGGN